MSKVVSKDIACPPFTEDVAAGYGARSLQLRAERLQAHIACRPRAKAEHGQMRLGSGRMARIRTRYTSEGAVTRASARGLMEVGQWPGPFGRDQGTTVIRTHEAAAERKASKRAESN